MGRGEAGVLPAESPTKALRGDGSVDDAWGGGAFAGGTLPQAHPGDGAVLGYAERVTGHGLVLLPLVPVLDVAEDHGLGFVHLDHLSFRGEIVEHAGLATHRPTVAEAVELLTIEPLLEL